MSRQIINNIQRKSAEQIRKQVGNYLLNSGSEGLLVTWISFYAIHQNVHGGVYESGTKNGRFGI